MLDIEVIVKLYPVGKCADCTVLLKTSRHSNRAIRNSAIMHNITRVTWTWNTVI